MWDQKFLSQEIFGFAGLSFEAKVQAAHYGLRYMAEAIHLVARQPFVDDSDLWIDDKWPNSRLVQEVTTLIGQPTIDFVWSAPYHDAKFLAWVDQPLGAVLGQSAWWWKLHLAGIHYVGDWLRVVPPNNVAGWFDGYRKGKMPFRPACLPPHDWSGPLCPPREWQKEMASFTAAIRRRIVSQFLADQNDVGLYGLALPKGLSLLWYHQWNYRQEWWDVWSNLYKAEPEIKTVGELLSWDVTSLSRHDCFDLERAKFVELRLSLAGLRFGMTRTDFRAFLRDLGLTVTTGRPKH